MRPTLNDNSKTSAKLVLVFLFSLALVVAAACAPTRMAPPVAEQGEVLRIVDPLSVPLERDDLARNLLEEAINNSLSYYERLSEETIFKFGSQEVQVDRIKRSLQTFLFLLRETASWTELADRVRENFVIYRSVGRNAEQEVLFTGYFEPTIQGSLTPDEHFRYPIYGVPDDLVNIDLGLFRDEYRGVKLVGRSEGNRVVPYYNREEIDFYDKLAGKGYELVWVADPVELFFLRIQGSGRIRLLNGDSIRLGYAAKNGWPWRPIGRLMIEEGLIPKEAQVKTIELSKLKRKEQTLVLDSVRKVYNIKNDDANLRQISKEPEQNRGKFFDNLRKNYPVRREFQNTRVIVKDAESSLANKLRGIGFEVVTHES